MFGSSSKLICAKKSKDADDPSSKSIVGQSHAGGRFGFPPNCENDPTVSVGGQIRSKRMLLER